MDVLGSSDATESIAVSSLMSTENPMAAEIDTSVIATIIVAMTIILLGIIGGCLYKKRKSGNVTSEKITPGNIRI